MRSEVGQSVRVNLGGLHGPPESVGPSHPAKRRQNVLPPLRRAIRTEKSGWLTLPMEMW